MPSKAAINRHCVPQPLPIEMRQVRIIGDGVSPVVDKIEQTKSNIHMNCCSHRSVPGVAVNAKELGQGSGARGYMQIMLRSASKMRADSIVLDLIAAAAFRVKATAGDSELKTSRRTPTIKPSGDDRVHYTRRHRLANDPKEFRRAADRLAGALVSTELHMPPTPSMIQETTEIRAIKHSQLLKNVALKMLMLIFLLVGWVYLQRIGPDANDMLMSASERPGGHLVRPSVELEVG